MKVNAISFQAFNNTNKNKINHKDSTSQDFCVTQNALNSNHIYIPNFKAINRVQVEKKLASFNLGLQFIRNNPNILNNLKENGVYSEKIISKVDDLYRKIISKKISPETFLPTVLDIVSLDIDKLINTIDGFIARGINGISITTAFNDCTYRDDELERQIDFEKIDRLLAFRDKAIEKKHLLQRCGDEVKDSEVDEIIFAMPNATYKTLNLLGEQTFIYAFKEKKDNLKDYIRTLGLMSFEENLNEELLQLINPTKSKRYRFLTNNIKDKKNTYKNLEHKAEHVELRNEINSLTKELNTMMKVSLKDPKDILETALITSAVKDRPAIAITILNSLKQGLKNSREVKELLNEAFYYSYDLVTPTKEVLSKLDFTNSKYLPKLYGANQRFKNAFAELVLILNDYPEKSNLEIFNNLPQNITTRRIFEKNGINYDRWVNANPNIYIELPNDNKCNSLRYQKVDMNNIPHSLMLGEDSLCCTRLNGTFSQTAANYIKNKMFQAIEVYDKDLPIGNTMCYFVKANGKLCLVLDNIEVRPQYQNNNTMLEGFVNVAKMILQDVGVSDTPIILGATRNDVPTAHMSPLFYDIEILGSSGEDKVYFDFQNSDMILDKENKIQTDVKFFKLTANAPESSYVPYDFTAPSLTFVGGEHLIYDYFNPQELYD